MTLKKIVNHSIAKDAYRTKPQADIDLLKKRKRQTKQTMVHLTNMTDYIDLYITGMDQNDIFYATV